MNAKRNSIPVIAMAVSGWIAAAILLGANIVNEGRAELAQRSAQLWMFHAAELTAALEEHVDPEVSRSVILPPYSESTCKLLTAVADGHETSLCDEYRHSYSDAL